MLCSAKELGLADATRGILELPADAPVGTSLREYLQLDDSTLELNVTATAAMPCPSWAWRAKWRRSAARRCTRRRGLRCRSCVGRAATRAAGSGRGLPEIRRPRYPWHRQQPRDADWLRERLRRAGVRSISPAGGRHQLRAAGARPAHARLRSGKGEGGHCCAHGARRLSPSRCSTAVKSTLEADMLVIADEAGASRRGGHHGRRAHRGHCRHDVTYFSKWHGSPPMPFAVVPVA